MIALLARAGRALRAIPRGLRRLVAFLAAPYECPHATPGQPECHDCWESRQW